ncbi:hypothetical protein ACI6Q2_14260 [Chitinophagaceae bacterium LWZ2-11]
MKNLIKAGVVTLSLVLGIAVTTNAQTTKNNDGRPKGILLSVGPDANLPIGNLKDGYDWSLGGSVQADFPVVSNALYVTVNAGYDNFFAKNSIANAKDLQLIPVKAGLKFYAYKGLYVQGQAGVSFVGNKTDVGADKSAAFVYSPQIGYLIPLGKSNYLDAGVKFESNTKFSDNGTNSNFFGLRVAYAFSL